MEVVDGFFSRRLSHSPQPVNGFLPALQLLTPLPGSGTGDDTFLRSAWEMSKATQDENFLWGRDLCDFETYLSLKYWFQPKM